MYFVSSIVDGELYRVGELDLSSAAWSSGMIVASGLWPGYLKILKM